MGHPKRILAVMDETDTQVALLTAAALADRHGSALSVFAGVEVPHDLDIVARLSGNAPDELVEKLLERTRSEVDQRLAQILPGRDVDVFVSVGKAFVEIIKVISNNGCDFVIKVAEPVSVLHRFLFASTDQHLLRNCPCPVWLQTPNASVEPKKVLAAVDLDLWDAAEPETLVSLNKQVVEVASTIATAADAEVVVLHAWEAVAEGLVWAFSTGPDARRSANRYVDELLNARRDAMEQFIGSVKAARPGGPPLAPRLVRGTPEKAIFEESQALKSDVVVMGTVARTGLSGAFIGNTAENIINNLECPVLAVKPTGFQSPALDK